MMSAIKMPLNRYCKVLDELLSDLRLVAAIFHRKIVLYKVSMSVAEKKEILKLVVHTNTVMS